jgi:excisionase family DNA binding protein
MRWMKVGPACEYLGGIHRETLYDAVRSGKCIAARIGSGRNLLFSDVWLDAYATRCAEQPSERHDSRRSESIALMRQQASERRRA